MRLSGFQTVVLVGVVAIVLPIVARILSSPLALLLLSPFIVSVLGVSFLVAYILFGHLLDANVPRRQYQLVDAARPFAFSSPAAWQAVVTRSQWSQGRALPLLNPDSPELSKQVNEIITLIIRDFVQVWYKEISSSSAFPEAVGSLVHTCMKKLLDRAAGVDITSVVVKRILPKVTMHIELFRQSEVAIRGAGLERRLTQSEELDLLLAGRYSAGMEGGKLHPAIANLSTTFTKQTEEAHLRHLIDAALPLILPQTEGRSAALKLVAREIVACAVLFPVMEMVSDPDFWNKAIDQVAGAAIHQQKLITKVRNVLEAQSPQSQNRLSRVSPSVSTAEAITIRTDPRQFESFLRSIGRFSSLLDARRLKNDIVGEIRRTRVLLANHDKEDWINGEKTEDVVAYLDRLYTAKRKVEQRIVTLGGEDDSRHSTYPDHGPPKSGLTLRDILRNPNSLSYFMEFMDRRNRSLLVQFWLTVESFKNPLESVDSDSEAEEDEPPLDPATARTIKEDVSMIHDLYFSGPTPHPLLRTIPAKFVTAIQLFSANDTPTSEVVQNKARRSVMLAQRQVEKDMEQDFEEFERSELWFRAVGDIQSTQKANKPLLQHRQSPSSSSLFDHETHDYSASMQRTLSSSSKASVQSSSSAPSVRPAPSNIEVLMSPVSEESDFLARAPLFDDPDDHLQRAEEQRMQAIQAALTDIMASDAEKPSARDSRVGGSRGSKGRDRHKPMFDDDDGEDEADEDETQEDLSQVSQSFQLPAPGDLHLSYEISRLGEKLSSLLTQETMLDSLIKKAELTGDNQELRLLNKSKAAMAREIRELRFQKLQYEQQESANRLISERTKVAIVSSAVAEEEGKSVVRYLIEVQQLAPDGSFASGWIVARRYNEFLTTHNKLREKYAGVRNLEFPGKRLVTALSGSIVDTRKVALEKYLQNAIAISVVCESDELRAFLSRDSPFTATEPPSSIKSDPPPFSGTNLVRNVYRSVTESIDDMFFGPSMLDVMIGRLTRQVAEFAGIVGTAVDDEELVAQALNASGKSTTEAAMMLSPDLKPLEGETSTSSFTAPICDLILAVFELQKENSWLRRQAIVIILQQVLGGAIERKMRETAKALFVESKLMPLVDTFRNGLWPGGKLKPPGVQRTTEEKNKTRDEANRKLSSLVPDLAANMIGRSNARRGARRIFAVLQNRRLNQHIAYTIVDEVFSALFPEIGTSPGNEIEG